MIRNKSQTTHFTGSKRKGDTSMDSNPRHKSKKASLNLSKPNHLNYSHAVHPAQKKTETSVLSSALNSNRHSAKTLLTGTKGMKIVNNHESSMKPKLPSVKLQQNAKSAISARILKDIVSYNNTCKNNTDRDRCVQSLQIVAMKKPTSSNNTHRVLEEFSPMPGSKSNSNLQFKKMHKNNSALSSINKTYMVRDFQVESKEYLKQNFQSFNGKTSQLQHQDGNKEVEFIFEREKDIPTRDQLSDDATPRDTSRIKKQMQEQQILVKNGKRKKSFFNNKPFQSSEKINSGQILENSLQLERQQLVFTLERANNFIEENFILKYKQIINDWDTIIEKNKENQRINKAVEQYQQKVKLLTKHCNDKKTELYLHNREHIINKKQKDHVAKSAKQHYLTQAERIHQDIRQKLTSKADYEHVIMFNMKVVLSGTTNYSSMYYVYEEMFRNALCRKFILIAKKEMGNLSSYDCKLVQQFFKKIQDLENGYIKIQKQMQNNSHRIGVSSISVLHPYSQASSKQFFVVIEQLVEQIQEYSLEIQTQNRKLKDLAYRLEVNKNELRIRESSVEEHIKKVSQEVSEQYHQSEGKQYDFQVILSKKYTEEYLAYQEEIENRQKITNRLNQIQLKFKKNQIQQQQDRDEEAEEDLYLQQQQQKMEQYDKQKVYQKLQWKINNESSYHHEHYNQILSQRAMSVINTSQRGMSVTNNHHKRNQVGSKSFNIGNIIHVNVNKFNEKDQDWSLISSSSRN